MPLLQSTGLTCAAAIVCLDETMTCVVESEGVVVLVRQAGGSEDLGRWLGVLFAETGSTSPPEELHYDYIDVDTLTDIRHAARHSFL